MTARMFAAALCLSSTLGSPLAGQQWRAQRVLRVGEEEGVSFGRIGDIRAAPDGRIFVLDAMESRVHVFSQTGKPERTFGRRGGGPGELSSVATAVLPFHDQLVVVDAINQRINLFSREGVFVRSRPLSIMGGMPVAWTTAGERLIYLVRPLPMMSAQANGISAHTLLSLDPRNDLRPDTLLRVQLPPDAEMTGGSGIAMRLNLGASQVYLSGDGVRMLVAVSDTYRIRVLAGDGKTTSWLTRTITRHRYTSGELTRMKETADSAMAAGIRSGAAAAGAKTAIPRPNVEYVMPVHAPAITGVLAGNRFVLIGRSTSDQQRTPTDWDILAHDGRFLGTVTLPARFRPHSITGDRVYGVEKDELDVQSAAVYQITPK